MKWPDSDIFTSDDSGSGVVLMTGFVRGFKKRKDSVRGFKTGFMKEFMTGNRIHDKIFIRDNDDFIVKSIFNYRARHGDRANISCICQ